MPSYQTPIRWREDTGWEARCGECADRTVAAFWPLTDEFWDKRKTMRRCRSCQKAREARIARERYLTDTTVRERRRASARKYRLETLASQRIKAQEKWATTKADPEKWESARARARASQVRYRAKHRKAA